MATNIEKMRWLLYNLKAKRLTKFAVSRGLIKTYDDDYLERMSNYYYHGIPGSIMLLALELTSRRCMELGPFLTLGLEDEFRIVYAYINSIKYNPENIDAAKDGGYEIGKHCFVEVITKDKQIVVYDPSRALIYDRDIYYAIENPQIFGVLPKKNIVQMESYDNIKKALPEIDDYAKKELLPLLDNPSTLTTIYHSQLLNGIKKLKDKTLDVNIIK